MPGGVRQAYSIDLQGYEQFDDLITISLPYDPAGTDPKNEKGSVFAEYRDKKSGEWVTVKHRVDTAKHEVLITTDHLSDYCVVTVKDSNTPYAKLSSLESLYLDDQTAVQVLQEFQQKDADQRPKSASPVKQFYIRDDAKAYCPKQYVACLGQSEMMQQVFEHLCERISYDCDRELEKQLTVLRRSLNEPLTITVTKLAKGGKGKYAGGTAVLHSRRGKKAGYWQVCLDENDCGKVEATVLGYMQAGLPTVLEIWPAGSDPDHDKPAINLTFKVSQKTTDLKVVTNHRETASPTPEKTKEAEVQPYKEEQLKSFAGIYIIPKQMRKPDVGNKFGPLYSFSSYLSEFAKRAQNELNKAVEDHRRRKDLAAWRKEAETKVIRNA